MITKVSITVSIEIEYDPNTSEWRSVDDSATLHVHTAQGKKGITAKVVGHFLCEFGRGLLDEGDSALKRTKPQ